MNAIWVFPSLIALTSVNMQIKVTDKNGTVVTHVVSDVNDPTGTLTALHLTKTGRKVHKNQSGSIYNKDQAASLGLKQAQ